MKEKTKIIEQTIKRITWVLKNPYLKNYIITLINEFVSGDFSISKIVVKKQLTIELTKENADILFISISSDSNKVKIVCEKNRGDITSFKEIKRCDNEIEVVENDSSVVRKKRKVISTHIVEKNKLYRRNHLVKSELNEFFDTTKTEPNKSYSIHEETKVLPNGSAIVKYDGKACKNSDKLNGILYFEIDTLLDILFDDSKDHTNELQELNLSFEQRYNSLLMLHELMMLPVRYVDVKYIDENGNTKNVFGLLSIVNEDSIELFIDNDFIVYKLDSIISVSYSGRQVYKKDSIKDKLINLEND